MLIQRCCDAPVCSSSSSARMTREGPSTHQDLVQQLMTQRSEVSCHHHTPNDAGAASSWVRAAVAIISPTATTSNSLEQSTPKRPATLSRGEWGGGEDFKKTHCGGKITLPAPPPPPPPRGYVVPGYEVPVGIFDFGFHISQLLCCLVLRLFCFAWKRSSASKFWKLAMCAETLSL